MHLQMKAYEAENPKIVISNILIPKCSSLNQLIVSLTSSLRLRVIMFDSVNILLLRIEKSKKTHKTMNIFTDEVG